jgi:hypothetical protein
MTTGSVAKQPHKTREQWAAECRGWQRKTVEGFLGLGKTLIKAKADLDHGEWLPFLHDDLKINARVAQELMRLARNRRFANASNSSYLPSSFSALVALGRLSDDDFATCIESGAINPGTTAREAKQVLTVMVTRGPPRLVTPVYHRPAETDQPFLGWPSPPRPDYQPPDPLLAHLDAIEEGLPARLEGDRLERALAGLEQIRTALAEPPTGEVVPLLPPS